MPATSAIWNGISTAAFQPAVLADLRVGGTELEIRARRLLAEHGPRGGRPCTVVFDLHSTTSAMGNSLVLYGRRPADLALAAALQARLGLPIYLHEADDSQTGFLVETLALRPGDRGGTRAPGGDPGAHLSPDPAGPGGGPGRPGGSAVWAACGCPGSW